MSVNRVRINHRSRLVLVGLVTLAFGVLGLASGIWLEHEHLPSRVVAKVRSTLDKPVIPQTQVVRWRNINTNLHELQVAAVRISEVKIDGGSLVDVGDNIVIASPLGQLSYLDARNELHSLNVHVPMNIERLRDDPLYHEPLFNVAFVRTHDLLAIQTGTNTYDLYASFNRFAGRCFEFVVSRIPLEARGSVIRATGPWRDIWTAKPCVRLKDRGTLFVGAQSGGRMVQASENTILVSVGDHQFDGFYDSQAVSMDAESDLGKLIEVNIRTGASRQFARGLRNPQGLVIARNGRIWETEHGPQGGDEVNLMKDGQNYGWPIVTYGMSYGYPLKNWPFNPKPGRHDGYTRPRFAFVPSIGISNIIEPDPRQFPNWEGTLILCSLRASTLYVLKTEEDDIVYAEPIPLEHYRLRDIASLHDGRLAILADGGTLLFVRNADKYRDDRQHLQVSGLTSLPQPLPEEAPPPSSTTPVQRGRQYFAGACGNCHSLANEVGIGPPLNGIIGRPIAAVSSFGYSAALVDQHKVWTEQLLASFVNNPKAFSPGTSMPNTGIYVDQAKDIAAFLKTIR